MKRHPPEQGHWASPLSRCLWVLPNVFGSIPPYLSRASLRKQALGVFALGRMVPSQGQGFQPHLGATLRAPISVSGGLVVMDVHFLRIPPFLNPLHYFPSVPSPAFGMDSMPQPPGAVIP